MSSSIFFLFAGIIFFIVPLVRQQIKIKHISYHKFQIIKKYNFCDMFFYFLSILFIFQFLISLFYN